MERERICDKCGYHETGGAHLLLLHPTGRPALGGCWGGSMGGLRLHKSEEVKGVCGCEGGQHGWGKDDGREVWEQFDTFIR